MARRILAAFAAVSVVGGLTACEPVPVVDLVVDSTVDAVDAAPGDGVCSTATGACTLRAAIQEANALDDRVVITLADSATYTLTLPGRDEDAGAAGDLDVAADHVTIHGNGSTVTAGRAWQTNPYPTPPSYRGGIDRVLDHHSGVLNIDHLGITGGYVDHSGGGLRSTATLVLNTVSVGGNETYGEGDTGGMGLHQDGGTLMLLSSSVSYNRHASGEPGTVGGLFQAEGTAIILASTIHGNRSNNSHAGYHPLRPYDGWLYQGDFAGYRQTGGTGLMVNSVVSGHFSVEPLCTYSPTFPPNCTGSEWHFGPGVRADGQLEIVSSRLVGNNQQEPLLGFSTFDLEGTATVRGSIVETCAPGAMTSLGYNRVGSDCPVGPTDRTEGPDVDQIPIGTPGLCDGSVATDRLGVTRPQGGACDIGDEEH